MTSAVAATSDKLQLTSGGSGIFLVEAFHRIVRFETAARGPLSAAALRDILRRSSGLS